MIKINKEDLIRIANEVKYAVVEGLNTGSLKVMFSRVYYKPKLKFDNYDQTASVGFTIDGTTPKEVLPYYNSDIVIDAVYKKYEPSYGRNAAIMDFIRTLVVSYLQAYTETNLVEVKNLNLIIDRFIQNLNDEPGTAVIKVKLRGVGFGSNTLSVNIGSINFSFADREETLDIKTYAVSDIQILLRRPESNDVKKSNEEAIASGIRLAFETPSSILEIKMLIKPSVLAMEFSNGFRHFSTLINKIFFALKLYKVMNIVDVDTSVEFESVINVLGFSNSVGFGSKSNIPPFINYHCVLKESQYDALKLFLKQVFDDTPNDYNGWRKYLPMAYDMYSEAIQSDVPMEKRIAYVIMGLESLLSNSDKEIRYRLSLNVAKFMSLLDGAEGADVLRRMKLAYDIRSDYVHGNRKKLEADLHRVKKHFGNEDDFVKYLLYCLSKMLIITVNGSNKNQFRFINDLEALLVTKDNEAVNKFFLDYINPIKLYIT